MLRVGLLKQLDRLLRHAEHRLGSCVEQATCSSQQAHSKHARPHGVLQCASWSNHAVDSSAVINSHEVAHTSWNYSLLPRILEVIITCQLVATGTIEDQYAANTKML
jgi:hypothetical protein